MRTLCSIAPPALRVSVPVASSASPPRPRRNLNLIADAGGEFSRAAESPRHWRRSIRTLHLVTIVCGSLTLVVSAAAVQFEARAFQLIAIERARGHANDPRMRARAAPPPDTVSPATVRNAHGRRWFTGPAGRGPRPVNRDMALHNHASGAISISSPRHPHAAQCPNTPCPIILPDPCPPTPGGQCKPPQYTSRSHPSCGVITCL